MKAIIDFLKRWNEIILIPLALVALIMIAPVTLIVEPNAAPYTGEVFEVVTYSLIVVGVFISMSFLFMKLLFPVVFDFKDVNFSKFYTNQKAWVKALILFGLLFVFLCSFLVVFSQLM